MIGLFLVAGCAKLPQVELEITRAEVARAYSNGALILAPAEYRAASDALHDAELLVYRAKYRSARKALNLALLHAAKASVMAQEKAAVLEAEHQAEMSAIKAARVEKVKKKKVKNPVKKKPAPPKLKPIPPKTKTVLLDKVQVLEGETLYSLAGRKDIYGDPLLWPLIYEANRDQIKDPQQIFEGQDFTIPRDKNGKEEELARRKARESGLFGH